MPSEQPPLWESQVRAMTMIRGAVADGYRAIVVCAPTGAGKTRVMREIAVGALLRGKRVALFTNRKLLTAQAVKAFKEIGVAFGVMAADYDADLTQPAQIASFQTIESRVFNRRSWMLPRADVVLVDEAHSNKGDMAARVITSYRARGAIVLGFSATPVGLGEPLYETLLVTATKVELRKAGVLVPCRVFAPDEPDMQGVRRNKVGEYVKNGATRRIMETIIFGDVFTHWETLNPERRPTILFAPGVPESRWFVEQFRARGATAAHIDADTTDAERAAIMAGSEDGSIQVVSSCGVLREGVDMPWLYYGILCQVCGTASGYYQTVGRLMRAYTKNPRYVKDHCLLQDHSGAWHRIGSPNADPKWQLGKTDVDIAGEGKASRERGEEREPIRCPQCGGIRLTGPACPHCGFSHTLSVRAVRMVDGTLKQMAGNTVKKRAGDDERVWKSCLFAGGMSGKSMAQVRADFQRRSRRALPEGLPYCPDPGSMDWGREVAELYPWTAKRRKKAG